MFKLTQKLAGKVTKDGGEEIFTTTTPGGFRITPRAVGKMGLACGDYVLLAIYEDAEGKKFPAITKSTKDAAGSSKLAYASGKDGTGALVFSCSFAYAELGGGSNSLKGFTVEDGVVPTDENGNTVEGAGLAYVLTFKEDVAKQIRVKKAKGEKTATAEVATAEVSNGNDFE